jgi:hypothetical protein
VHQIEAIAWDLLAAGGGANKLRNAEGLAEEFSNDVTAIENQRSVTKVSHLFEVGGNEKNCQAVLSLAYQEMIDVRSRANIYSDGWFFQD